MTNKIVLIVIAVLIVILAGLFSGAETGMYRLSRLRLRLGIEKRRLPFIILGKIMRDSGGLLLSMLVGTNLAHYPNRYHKPHRKYSHRSYKIRDDAH